MKTLIGCLSLLSMVLVNTLNAQTFEEYEKLHQSEVQKFDNKQLEGTPLLHSKYAEYVAKQDKNWTEYLLKEWENYQAFAGKKLPERPKPIKTPTYTPDDSTPTIATKELEAVEPEEQKKEEEQQPPLEEPILKPLVVDKDLPTVSLNFYGHVISIPYDKQLSRCVVTAVSQPSITTFWENASTTNYTPTIEMLLQVKASMNINDYGYLLITQQFAEKIYAENKNLSRLLTWFLMVRSGYGVRIAYQNNELALLLPSTQEVYELSYLKLSGINYYVYPMLTRGSYYTYEKDYQDSGKMINFNIPSSINFVGRKVTKNLVFFYKGKSYTIQTSYDPDLIEFYKSYPLLDLDVYFNAAPSVQTKESLANALLPILSTMDEQTAVGFILSFVQHAFSYKTDPEQFGREKFFFVDEMFYYPFSDCEDRSILFSYLIREILGLKVIGLSYHDHVAAAVALTNPIPGDYIVYDNTKYFVTDPTYINAPIGVSMPQYKTLSARLYKIDK